MPLPLAQLPPRRRDRHLARPLRPPRHGDRTRADPHPVRPVPGTAGRRRPSASAGACRRTASSSWTGTTGRRSPGCSSSAHRGPPLLRARPSPATSTLWGSWVIAGRRRRVFYTGDTGYFPGFAEIGAEHGPFDLTLIQIGAYSPYWPDIHMTPEEAVATHLDVRGGLLLPVHWATFNLALHSWGEPVDRIWARGQGARRHAWPSRGPASGSRSTTRPRSTAGGRRWLRLARRPAAPVAAPSPRPARCRRTLRRQAIGSIPPW